MPCPPADAPRRRPRNAYRRRMLYAAGKLLKRVRTLKGEEMEIHLTPMDVARLLEEELVAADRVHAVTLHRFNPWEPMSVGNVALGPW